MGSRQKGAESLLFAEFCKKFPVLRRMSRRDRFVYDCTHHHPVFRYRTPRVIRAFVPRTAGFFEFVLVSASVSTRQKGGSGPSVSASKNSVPDSDVRDRFDDWVVGLQFVPDYLHHPVFRYRTQRVIRAFVPRPAGFFEFVLVSASVSARQKGGSGRSVSASKNSVPDSDVRDGFDDWVVGLQFVPDYLHHPVLVNRRFLRRRQIGRFCGDFRPLNSLVSVSAGVRAFE